MVDVFVSCLGTEADMFGLFPYRCNTFLGAVYSILSRSGGVEDERKDQIGIIHDRSSQAST